MSGTELRLIAELRDEESGRMLKTFTTQPGVCFYTAKGLNVRQNTVHGLPYGSSWGACLETQHHPDSPNHKHFPSTVLRPGETYKQVTIYKMEVE
jgi:aldose 1-epimerase